jgi:hypothetical protein
MDMNIKDKFLAGWDKYFGASELPIICYYGDAAGAVEQVKPSKGWSCLICELARVRKGASLSYDESALGCGGAKRYLGFTTGIMPGIFNMIFIFAHRPFHSLAREVLCRTPAISKAGYGHNPFFDCRLFFHSASLISSDQSSRHRQ